MGLVYVVGCLSLLRSLCIICQVKMRDRVCIISYFSWDSNTATFFRSSSLQALGDVAERSTWICFLSNMKLPDILDMHFTIYVCDSILYISPRMSSWKVNFKDVAFPNHILWNILPI